MAAYAALVSIMHIIEQIQHYPRPPISFDENQVQSLTEKVAFLQEFLEVYSHVRNEEVEGLQSRIAEVAYEAEDVIESHIVDQILAQSTTHEERIRSVVDFCQGLQKVMRDMELIKKEVVEIKEKMGSARDTQLHGSISVPTADSSRSPSKVQNIMVGFDDVLIQLLDKLTGQQSNRQVIPIVGMGGIGKTTLARNAYENLLIKERFYIRAWVTISQEYSVKEILLEILLKVFSCKKNQENRSQENKNQDIKETLREKTDAKLGEMLYKILFERRYLIIMDDMWSIEVWDKVKSFFPDNNNGSRVIITTRLSDIASHLPSACGLEMNFLDDELSWDLLCKIVFGEDRCPLELKKIGKKIAKNCKGLPLSIVVIGGLLAKSEQTKKCWKDIAENFNSIVNLEDNERCFKLLCTSYNHLPVHLKPCFLYMGVFPEDTKIRVSYLIKLWVAEGFLKPIIGKSLEETAKEYLKDLIGRNLIVVHEWGSSGEIKFCKIHDLLRDLCLREAHKERFLCVTKLDSINKKIDTMRRIAIHGSILESTDHLIDPSQYASLVRSLICESPVVLTNNRLLRVLKLDTQDFLRNIFFQSVNLRFLDVVRCPKDPKIPSSVCLLWNLQTLIHSYFECTIEIWKMPLLRHVKFCSLFLPDPSSEIDSVLENLQTLSNVVDFRCSEEMVKMIPNIKKLQITYVEKFEGSHYSLNNLGHLHKLESLSCDFYSSAKPSRSDLMQNLSFPQSLKKLTLEGSNLHWEDISTKIGSLPLLQVLKLKRNSFEGPKWETVEGQFHSLKYLLIVDCGSLNVWSTDSTHFPSLEHLVLRYLTAFEEIPMWGEIPTLQSIELICCSTSAMVSAKDIAKEQEQLGNDSLQVVTFEVDPTVHRKPPCKPLVDHFMHPPYHCMYPTYHYNESSSASDIFGDYNPEACTIQ